MVKSGLVDRVDVSHYRLALHLTVAFLILSLLVWLASSLDPDEPRPLVPASSERRVATLLVPLILAQSCSAPSWRPQGRSRPQHLAVDGRRLLSVRLGCAFALVAEPDRKPAAAQFHHRLMAYLVVVSCWCRRGGSSRPLAMSA